MKRTLTTLALMLLLSSCGINTMDEGGRHPVTLTVGDTINCGLAPRCEAQVRSMNEIYALRGYEDNLNLIAHELVHTVQWREYGAVGFPIAYALQVVSYGYQDAPFEVEARELANDPWYEAWAADLISTLED